MGGVKRSRMINFKQTNHSSRLARAALETENGDNLVISGSDGVPISINNLWLFSPLVRSILDSLTKVEDHLIILPGHSSEDITNGLRILTGPGPDDKLVFFNQKAKVVLETLGVDLTNSELIKRTDASNLKIESRIVEKHRQEVNCVYCERTFVGSLSKLKDKLKCHIGNIHFCQEMEKEISVFFNKDHKCKECGKTYHQDHMKRKHLTFNHSYLVEEIMDQVYQSLDMESAKYRTKPVNELSEDKENVVQKMLGDQHFGEVEQEEEQEEEEDDFQNQLMLIQNLSDSEDEDDDDDHDEVTISDDLGVLLIAPPKKQEIAGESLLIEDNFIDDEGADERYEISSDEEEDEKLLE